ncbi:acyltransferase family protein [Oxalobacteraceae sp. CFBP 8755]|nr:acyltransferase family protein [Oxalobacteraceae sp. CFBP 8755]
MQFKHGRIDSIDAMRVLAMLAVIQIHTPWYSKVNVTSLDVATIADQLARFAVPFFFVISGYLWASRSFAAADYWPRSVAVSKRVLIIFSFWSFIYAIGPSLYVIGQEGLDSLLANMLSVVYPFDSIRFLSAVLQGTKNHLWFLPALAIAALISGALLSKGRELTLFVLAILLFAVGLAGSAYSDTPYGFTSNFNFRNGPFFSLIMFSSGYAIHRYGQRLPLLPIGIGLATGGFALQLFETTWIHRQWGTPLLHDYIVGTYFFGLGMSMIALSNTRYLRVKALSSIGPLILGVYASHYYFVEHVRWLQQIVENPYLIGPAYLAVVFLLALGTSYTLAQWRGTRQFVT